MIKIDCQKCGRTWQRTEQFIELCTYLLQIKDCMTLTAGLDNGAEGQARYDGLMRYYRHGRDNQWMGASLDVSEDRAIVVRNHAAFTHVIF